MPTIYVHAKSKKEANEKIAAGKEVIGVAYSPIGTDVKKIQDYPDKTAVKIWEKRVGGVEYAKSYGVWDAKKQKIM